VEIIVLLIAIAITAGIGVWIAEQKGRSAAEGAALGCLLGPIGWIIEALLPGGGPTPSAPPPTWYERPPAVPVSGASAPLPPSVRSVANSADTEKKCPDCAEMVKAEARICRFCRHEFPEAPAPAPQAAAATDPGVHGTAAPVAPPRLAVPPGSWVYRSRPPAASWTCVAVQGEPVLSRIAGRRVTLSPRHESTALAYGEHSFVSLYLDEYAWATAPEHPNLLLLARSGGPAVALFSDPATP